MSKNRLSISTLPFAIWPSWVTPILQYTHAGDATMWGSSGDSGNTSSQAYQCVAFGNVYHPARKASRAIIGGMNAQQQEHGTSGQSRSLAGQVAIITGASRGIGRAAALAFAAEGAAVALAARDADALAANVARDHGGGRQRAGRADGCRRRGERRPALRADRGGVSGRSRYSSTRRARSPIAHSPRWRPPRGMPCSTPTCAGRSSAAAPRSRRCKRAAAE